MPDIASIDNVDGDSLVPLQSLLRANLTRPALLRAKNLQFSMQGYRNQVHAKCFTDPACMADVLAKVKTFGCAK